MEKKQPEEAISFHNRAVEAWKNIKEREEK
jgi:hypothetical protein